MITTKHTFFCDKIDDSQLSEEESHHAIRVLRLKLNDLITIIDGKGSSAIGKVSELNKKSLKFEIIDNKFEPINTNQIHIAIAPTKNVNPT